MKSFSKNNSDQDLLSEINVTPLVDVMLLLMVIFLVTAPLLINEINVKLPKTVANSQNKPGISKTIIIKENGELLFEKKITNLNQIEKELSSLNQNNELTIKIAADKNSHYQELASLLAILNKNKINNISFLTEN